MSTEYKLAKSLKKFNILFKVGKDYELQNAIGGYDSRLFFMLIVL